MPEICSNKKIKQEFLLRDKDFRINAVIHSGQWYTFDKWLKLSQVDREDLVKYLEETTIPIIHKQNSYRVNSEEVFRWYHENNLSIEEAIVPNDFSPRVWGGKTEVDVLLETPQHISNILLVYCNDINVLYKIKNILRGYAWCVYRENKKQLKIYTTSFKYIEQILTSQLTDREFNSLIIRYTMQRKWRSLSDFDEDFLGGFLMFYSNFSKQCLKPHMETIKTYISSHEDIESQIREWIMIALNKFDEKETVPFSAYLNSYLQFRPYELGNELLGDDLANFQKEHSRAVKELATELNVDIKLVDENLVRERMGYSDKNEYFSLLERTIEFNSLKVARDINWEDKNNEKQGSSIFDRKEKNEHDRKRQTEISKAIIKATIETEKYEDLETLLSNNFNALKYLNVSNEYKMSLLKQLQSKYVKYPTFSLF